MKVYWRLVLIYRNKCLNFHIKCWMKYKVKMLVLLEVFQLMSKLESVNPNELNTDKPSMLKRIFSRAKSSINKIFSRMQSVSAQVDRITIQLQKHQTH